MRKLLQPTVWTTPPAVLRTLDVDRPRVVDEALKDYLRELNDYLREEDASAERDEGEPESEPTS